MYNSGYLTFTNPTSNCFTFVIYYSLCSLKHLQVLDLSYNDFSNGLPSVVGKITTLNTLELRHCRLKELPQRYV